MVRIEELPEELQRNVGELHEKIKEVDNGLEASGVESEDETLGCIFAIVAITDFENGADSWKFLKSEEDIAIFKGYLCKIGERKLLRDLLELEWYLKEGPLTKRSYCPF